MFSKLTKLFLLSLALMTVACSHHSYDRYDMDKDGKVTKKEWSQKHDSKFKKLDKNGDGVLSGDELKSKKKCKSCKNKKHCKDKKKCDVMKDELNKFYYEADNIETRHQAYLTNGTQSAGD